MRARVNSTWRAYQRAVSGRNEEALIKAKQAYYGAREVALELVNEKERKRADAKDVAQGRLADL